MRTARTLPKALCRRGQGSRRRPCDRDRHRCSDSRAKGMRRTGRAPNASKEEQRYSRQTVFGRRIHVHFLDLRPARQSADRIGQRPSDNRRHPAAVGVVSRVAVFRHIARPVVRVRARIWTEHARRVGAVDGAAPLPRTDGDRVHVACGDDRRRRCSRLRKGIV